MTLYLNVKATDGTRETVDSVDICPTYFPTPRAVRREAARLVSEYRLCGMSVYVSTRACANWKG